MSVTVSTVGTEVRIIQRNPSSIGPEAFEIDLNIAAAEKLVTDLRNAIPVAQTAIIMRERRQRAEKIRNLDALKAEADRIQVEIAKISASLQPTA